MVNEVVEDNFSQRKRRHVDLISALSDNLIETILMKLPFRDAVRTCTFSSRWRYSWVKLPCLTLDGAFWKQSLQNENQSRAARFAVILFRILLLHQGPVTNISLHVPKLESPPELDTLITFLVRNGVEKCCLESFPEGRYKLHSSLFTCPTLIILDLRCCEISFIPSTFEGFSNLTSFFWIDVSISVQALESLLSSCPSLETLGLKISINISCLKINAPKLVHFLHYYSSSSQSSPEVNNGQQQQSILKFLGGFPDLKNLIMDGHSLKSLTGYGFPTTLPTGVLHHLKCIHLVRICLEEVDQFSTVLCLIRSSPNLRNLKVNRIRSTVINNNNMDNLQEEEDYSNLSLDHLVKVEMQFVVGGRLELQLIKILLANSPSLRKLTIGLDSSKIADKGLKIIKEMVMFRRAAPNVEVHIKD